MKKKLITSALSLALLSTSISSFAGTDVAEPYIIKFNDEFKGNTHIPKGLLKKIYSGKFKKTFKSVFSGGVVDLTEKQVKKISKMPFVKMIEKDSINSISAINWGQDRIDQRDLPLDGSYSVTNDGAGANIYIIDSGINVSHSEFAGRIGTVTSTISGGATADCQGHGTHVASIAAGETRGAAPDATINSIRVTHNCTGDGYASDIIEAFEWIIDNGQPNSIINFSMDFSSSLIQAVLAETVKDGHVVVTSAGNNGMNACNDNKNKYKQGHSIMVAASSDSDAQVNDLVIPFKNNQTWSTNFGACVNVYAPGHNIYAANYNNVNGFITDSGTSMASPFVAGIAAGYRSAHPNSSPQEVLQAILDAASTGKLSELGANSPNKLAYNIVPVPSVYWQPTEELFYPEFDLYFDEPFHSCTAGEKILVTVGRDSWGYYHRVWECK